MSSGSKDTNPKDAVGIGKIPYSTVPASVMAEVGVGMLEGACKYGRHNYRVTGVRASVYYDAAQRHMTDWWEGQDIDPDSQLSHITKAICSLVVLRDAMIQSKFNDDRPPKVPASHRAALQAVVDRILDREHIEPACTEVEHSQQDHTRPLPNAVPSERVTIA